MTQKLNITEDQYISLRKSGMSKEEIFAKHSGQQKGLGQRLLDVGSGVTNFLGGSKVAETFGTEIAALGAKTPQERALIRSEAPSVRETVGSGIQLGANLLPVGGIGTGLASGLVRGGLAPGIARTAGRVAAGAGTGYAFDVGRNLEQGVEGLEAFKPGAGTIAGGAIPILSDITGFVAKKGGQAVSRKLEEINLRLTPTEKQNLARKGQDVAKYLSQKKVTGTPSQRYAKVNKLYDAMEDKVMDKIKNQNIRFSKSKLIEELKQIPSSFSDDPELQQEASNTLNKLIKNLQSRKGNFISGETVQNLKRNYMKRAFAKNATDVVSDSRLAIGAYFKDRLDKYVPGLESLNKEYGLLIAANRILQKAISRSEIGLTGKLAGGAAGAAIGSAVGGPVGTAVGAAIGPQFGRVVAGTGVRSGIGATAQTLSQIEKAIQSLPQEAGSVSLKAVLNAIEKFRE